MICTCTRSKCNCVSRVLRVLHVSRVLHVLRVMRVRVSRVLLVFPKTGGEQKLVVWSWPDACIIT
jgi:hypothetical protein